MKTYLYNEPIFNGDELVGNYVKEMTEDDILKEYWDYWTRQMRKVNKEHLVNKENCIEDWCTVNWAWEKE
jgi:hypothetical protein